MATPGFRALRAGFPEARITLHLRESQRALVAGSPWFDEILPLRSHGARGLAPVREGLALRGRRFDLGLCLPDSFSAALLMRAAGVREIVGYRRGFRRLLLHRAIELPRGAGARSGRPMIAREEHVLGLVEAVGARSSGTGLELFVTEAEEEEARGVLAAEPEDAGLAVVAPGASYGPSKLWPASAFAEVGDALARAGARVLVVGTPEEASLVASVCDAMQERGLPLAGRLSLGGLKALLRSARVLVCNDAGARHIAVAFGVPTVVMMGPTSLEKTNLNLESVTVLSADVPCRPCYQRECPIDHRCMTRIPTARVREVALAALRGETTPLPGAA